MDTVETCCLCNLDCAAPAAVWLVTDPTFPSPKKRQHTTKHIHNSLHRPSDSQNTPLVRFSLSFKDTLNSIWWFFPTRNDVPAEGPDTLRCSDFRLLRNLQHRQHGGLLEAGECSAHCERCFLHSFPSFVVAANVNAGRSWDRSARQSRQPCTATQQPCVCILPFRCGGRETPCAAHGAA